MYYVYTHKMSVTTLFFLTDLECLVIHLEEYSIYFYTILNRKCKFIIRIMVPIMTTACLFEMFEYMLIRPTRFSVSPRAYS